MKVLSKIAFVSLVMLLSFSSRATEGMWIPTLLESLNESDMITMGMEISAEDIYSINQSSLKDAIARFGGGCTAELISAEGLLLTNHHCGYSQIQSHSSVENNYLKDGFWAMSRDQELVNPGLTATFIVRMEDVTAKVLADITDDMDEAARKQAISAAIVLLESKIAADGGMAGKVKPFNYGNAYFLIVSKTYRDVRLVGAPPSSVGKFGGDTDNWVWPRHTGDFSMFRIYAGEDNEPADQSDSNVPYKPAQHLHVSMDGVQEGDFTMVFGFPGRTEQYLTSWAVDYVMNTSNPNKIAMRDQSLAVIDRWSLTDPKIKIQYAAKQSGISNAWKKWKGQNMGLERNKALEVKRQLEKDFVMRAKALHKDEYIDVLAELKQQYSTWKPSQLARDYFIEYFYYGPELFYFAGPYLGAINNEAALREEGKWEGKLAELEAGIKGHFKDYNAAIDQEIFEVTTPMFLDGLPSEYEVPYLSSNFNQGALTKASSKLYKKSLFTSEEGCMKALGLLKSGNGKKLMKDPALIVSKEVQTMYWEQARPPYMEHSNKVDGLMRSYVKGLSEVFPDKKYWYDANSTLRLTYGKVEGSSPVDGMAYTYFTTSEGILAKYQPGHPDFDLPKELVSLLERKKWGDYATDGELRVCFTGSNHTTGGNSGSPALNAKGQLVGLNFDRSWESTMSDIMFDPAICRNIMVDIKYVLWIVDVYAKAGHLVDEMTLVRDVPETLEMGVIVE